EDQPAKGPRPLRQRLEHGDCGRRRERRPGRRQDQQGRHHGGRTPDHFRRPDGHGLQGARTQSREDEYVERGPADPVGRPRREPRDGGHRVRRKSLASRRVYPGGLSALLCFALVAPAAPPASTSSTTKGAFSTVPKGDPALASRASRPRAAAFASALYPDIAPAARMVAPAAPTVKLPEGYEVIVFAPH